MLLAAAVHAFTSGGPGGTVPQPWPLRSGQGTGRCDESVNDYFISCRY